MHFISLSYHSEKKVTKVTPGGGKRGSGLWRANTFRIGEKGRRKNFNLGMQKGGLLIFLRNVENPEGEEKRG